VRTRRLRAEAKKPCRGGCGGSSSATAATVSPCATQLNWKWPWSTATSDGLVSASSPSRESSIQNHAAAGMNVSTSLASAKPRIHALVRGVSLPRDASNATVSGEVRFTSQPHAYEWYAVSGG